MTNYILDEDGEFKETFYPGEHCWVKYDDHQEVVQYRDELQDRLAAAESELEMLRSLNQSQFNRMSALTAENDQLRAQLSEQPADSVQPIWVFIHDSGVIGNHYETEQQAYDDMEGSSGKAVKFCAMQSVEISGDSDEPVGYTSKEAIYVCQNELGMGTFSNEKLAEFPLPIYLRPSPNKADVPEGFALIKTEIIHDIAFYFWVRRENQMCGDYFARLKAATTLPPLKDE